MVLIGLLVLTVLVTPLGLARSQRWAPWLLGAGAALFGALWLMGRLRIPWPDLGLWAVFVLNPYLFLTLSYVLIVAGAVGTAVKLVRRWRPRPGP